MKNGESVFLTDTVPAMLQKGEFVIRKNDEVCTSFDPFVRQQLMSSLTMSWTALMTDGTIVYGDYERPGFEKCWTRFTRYCDLSNTVPKNIRLHMFGCPQVEFFEDLNGLDGFSIVRGVAREQSMNGSFKDYQSLTVSLLDENCEHINVRKFVWPVNDFEELSGKRGLTKANIGQLIFKNESEKRQKVQEYLNG